MGTDDRRRGVFHPADHFASAKRTKSAGGASLGFEKWIRRESPDRQACPQVLSANPS